MKTPLVSRVVTPGAPDALDSDELGFLRDLPGPKRKRKNAADVAKSSMATAGDAVIAYWAKDEEAAAKAGKTKIGASWDSTRKRASASSSVPPATQGGGAATDGPPGAGTPGGGGGGSAAAVSPQPPGAPAPAD